MILLLAAGAEPLYLRGMIFRTLVLLVAIMTLAGCPTADKKSKTAAAAKQKMKDQSGDASFQAFVGRLRKAVEMRDKATLASMLAPDFGYRWDNGPAGETPFAFWDRNRLWGELATVLSTRWTPHEGFMVAPPQFAANENYPGYRAGLTLVNGSWRFAYFVPAPPPGTPDAPPAAPSETTEDRPLPPLPQ